MGTLTITERYRNLDSSGNKLVLGITAEIAGAYPASGGYTFDTSSLGAIFSKINSVVFDFYQVDPENEFVGKISVPDNTDPTDPSFALTIYDEATGGMGYNEVGGGDTYAGTWYLRIEGVPLGGIDGDVI